MTGSKEYSNTVDLLTILLTILRSTYYDYL